MPLALTITSFIIAGLMLITLFIVFNTLTTYMDTINNYVKNIEKDHYLSKPVLVISNASIVNDTCIMFRINNTGSTYTLLDNSFTVIVDYYEDGTLNHYIEVLKYNESWYVVSITVGSHTYNVPKGYPIELKPGGSANIIACVSHTISRDKSVIISVCDLYGVRAEYVFHP